VPRSLGLMPTEALTQLAEVFRRRFLFNALLPTLVFTTATVGVIVECAGSRTLVASWWTALDTVSKVFTALAYAAAIWFLAGAVASQWRAIVRLFEGYPISAITERLPIDTPGVRWHREHAARLRGSKPELDPEKAYLRYPPSRHEELILPTRLGNVLLAAELYPYDRYRIDPVLFWPRLYPLLPDQFQADYEEFVMEHEFPLVVAFESAIAAIIGGVATLLAGKPPLTFVMLFGGGMLIAYGFYCLSISSAEEVGEQQRTAFDLYRDRLLEHWPTPGDVRDEKLAFEAIESVRYLRRISRLGSRPAQTSCAPPYTLLEGSWSRVN
jgi:hypothetical protein